MRYIVVMPGGFHPFHAGHAALYHSAVKAFNNADTYVAATNDTKTRPFPFAIKEKLAKLAGVADKHFVQVKSPFQPREITSHYNPEEDVLIFVRSEKDRNESPKPGGTKKDGTPAYFQPWTGKNVQPFGQHAYMAYLPTVEFGPGIKSATEIRNAWPKLDDRRKTAMVMSLYPVTQKNPKLAANVVKMLDMGMGNELAEGKFDSSEKPKWIIHVKIPDTKNGPFIQRSIEFNYGDTAEEALAYFKQAMDGRKSGHEPISYKDIRVTRADNSMDDPAMMIEGPYVQRIVHPNKINIYIRTGNNKPPLLMATDIPYQLLDKFVAKVIQKYPQFKQTDFSFKPADKINEFAPPGGDDREPDEHEILRKLAAQWWHGDEDPKAEKTLATMGWEIGQDESGEPDAGVFLVRPGDENGDSYIAFPESELYLDNNINEDYLDEN